MALIGSWPGTLAHSLAQLSQMSAQRAQADFQSAESPRIKLAVVRQISAHVSSGKEVKTGRSAHYCSAYWR